MPPCGPGRGCRWCRAFLQPWVSGLGVWQCGAVWRLLRVTVIDLSRRPIWGSTVLELGMLDLEEIATALQDQDSWEEASLRTRRGGSRASSVNAAVRRKCPGASVASS